MDLPIPNDDDLITTALRLAASLWTSEAEAREREGGYSSGRVAQRFRALADAARRIALSRSLVAHQATEQLQVLR